MYQIKDNFKGFPMAMFFLMMLAQSYSHSCLSRTQEGWLPYMDFPIPPLIITSINTIITSSFSVGKIYGVITWLGLTSHLRPS